MPEPFPLSRRAVLRLLGVAGPVAAVTTLAGCSAEQRDALTAVDPRAIRLDDGEGPVAPRPRPSQREQRRRAMVAGSLAASAAVVDAGAGLPVLVGRAGSAAAADQALAAHDEHVALLGGPPEDPAVPLLWTLPLDEGGPTLPAGRRPVAVLAAGAAAAVGAATAEAAADDVDLDLAAMHARIGAARAAQAAGLRGDGAPPLRWPTTSVVEPVVAALQDLLAQEHRARWSYGVVVAWASDRAEDARLAREDHTDRVVALERLVRLQGAEPVAAASTYPTDDAGTPVDGPVSAAALALRLEDAVTAASAVLLSAALADGAPEWVAAVTTALAESERCRWSWGGPLAVLPGG